MPATIKRVALTPVQGLSLACSFEDASAPERHTNPSLKTAPNNAGKEVWDLHNVIDDPTELHDLEKSNSAKLAEMQALFDQEAKANQVYPPINWGDLFPGFKKFQKQVRKQKK